MRPRRIPAAVAAALALLVIVGAALLWSGRDSASARDTGLLFQAVDNAVAGKGDVHARIATDAAHQAVVRSDQVTWYDQAGDRLVTSIPTSLSIAQVFGEKHFNNFKQDQNPAPGTLLAQLLSPLLFLVLIFFVLRQLKRSLPGMTLGKSRGKLVSPQTATVTFADVAGVEEAKQELEEIVQVLRTPERFAAMGARVPRGVLLNGPPGTGKTLLARAVAGEAGVPFHSMSGSEFVEMFVGVGAARVRDAFTEARKNAPAIIFIDEIDAVGRRRGGGQGSSNDEREQTLNQLLVEMDGFDNGAPVIVIAATNRPDVLDPALLRPGRFDRRVTVDIPDVVGRIAILRVHSKGKPLARDVDLGSVAKQTAGMSGADLANLVNEAALLAVRADREEITGHDMEEAAIRVMAGPQRVNSLLSDEEKAVVAHHEMGHALVSHALPHADPVHKISIVSRGRALGWTMIVPERDRVLLSRAQLTDQLAGLLGGRVAEELVYGADFITSGAADDIERATRLATRMVTELGMSGLGHRAFLPAEPGSPRSYSEQLAEEVDAEVDRLLAEATDRAQQVLTERIEILTALSLRLIEVETINAAEMAEILSAFPARSTPAHSPASRTRARVVSADTLPRSGDPDHRGALPPPPAGLASGIARLPGVRHVSVVAPRRRSSYLKRNTAAFLRLVAGALGAD